MPLFAIRLGAGARDRARGRWRGTSQPRQRSRRRSRAARASDQRGSPDRPSAAASVVDHRRCPGGDQRRPTCAAFDRDHDAWPGWRSLLQHAAGSLDAAVDARAPPQSLAELRHSRACSPRASGLIVVNARRSQRLAAQQMDFVATVSHELRTPLAVIRSAAQNLSAGVVHDAGAGPAVRRSDRNRGPAADRHGRAGARVRRPQSATGVCRRRGRSMSGALVRDVVAARRTSLLERRAHRVACRDRADDLPLVIADEDAIRRALQNLLGNALKYGARRPVDRRRGRGGRRRATATMCRSP